MGGWILLLALGGCLTPSSVDFDRDGIPDADDCAPEDPDIYPGSHDPLGDGIDQDCDGIDGSDGDGDGFHGLDDCDETDPGVHIGAEEIHGDGIDQDCDGLDSLVGVAASCGDTVLLDDRFEFGAPEATWIPRDTTAQVIDGTLACDGERCRWDRAMDAPIEAPCWQQSLTLSSDEIARCDIEWALRTADTMGFASGVRLSQFLNDFTRQSLAIGGMTSDLVFSVLPARDRRTLVLLQDGDQWSMYIDGLLLGDGVGAASMAVGAQTLTIEGDEPSTCRAIRGHLQAWQ